MKRCTGEKRPPQSTKQHLACTPSFLARLSNPRVRISRTMSVAALSVLKLEVVSPTSDETELWFQVRSAYLYMARQTHPDKGGDEHLFQEVNSAFELLKRIHNEVGIIADVFAAQSKFGSSSSETSHFAWGFYEEAASNIVAYKIQRAPTGRGKCSKSGEPIEAGEIRVGSMVLETGTYGRWTSLKHWRVPSSVWTGIDGIQDEEFDKVKKALNDMDGLVLCGFTDLDEEGKQAVAERVCNPENHAKKERKDKKKITIDSMFERGIVAQKKEAEKETKTSMVVKPRSFTTNTSAIVPEQQLKGKTIVLTGVFPEMGGGVGLSFGKGGVEEWILSLGGKVTGSVSKKTSILLVGEAPGRSKVDKATQLGVKLLKLEDLLTNVKDDSLDSAPSMEIDVGTVKFSKGFGGSAAKRMMKLENKSLGEAKRLHSSKS